MSGEPAITMPLSLQFANVMLLCTPRRAANSVVLCFTRSQFSAAAWYAKAGSQMRAASASVSATTMWRSTPTAAPPEKPAFGIAGPPRLPSAAR